MGETHAYPPDSGKFAHLTPEEKRKRLDVMVQLWQQETERLLEREDTHVFIASLGLHEYRYSVWLRFPEWERSVVIGQVVAFPQATREEGQQQQPVLFSTWRRDTLLKDMPDWKRYLPQETVFNITVRLTPGGLGEGSKWAIVMPREMIPRYKPAWPAQRDWVNWTNTFDWLAVAVGFIREMLDTRK